MKLISLIKKLQKINNDYKKTHAGTDPVIFSWNSLDGDMILCSEVKKLSRGVYTAKGPLKKLSFEVG